MTVSIHHDFYGIGPPEHLINKLFMKQLPAAIRDGLPTGAGVRRMRMNPLKIDMTPMVDLGFLLITFFVITTVLSKPTVMKLSMPNDSNGPSDELGESYVFTLLLDGEKNYYYEKEWERAIKGQGIYEISLDRVRELINGKQQLLDDTLVYKEWRKGLMILIKPSRKANYRTVVDMLDEAVISDVKKYALIKLSGGRKTLA